MATRTRFYLVTVAELQLVALCAQSGQPMDARFHTTKALLREIIADGQPTPQLTRNPSGAIEVNWLVNGNFMGLLVDEDGHHFWFEEPDGTEGYSHQGSDEVDDLGHSEFMKRARGHLVELGREIVDG